MKIVFVASEVAPFAKTGGLADVAGALPKALKKLGHDVRIIMPFYTCVEKGGFGVRKGRKSVEVQVGSGLRKGLLRWTELGDIPVYLLENPEYFHREGLYGTPAGDYPDNAERFAFFCKGVLQLLKKMDFRPDIIHCNDWQTALIPLLMERELESDPFYGRTSTVFTIHNLAYQGVFDREALARMALDPSFFTVDCLEYYGRVNLMK
ncbi:MAG TPA: glycogen/starch synthase, partial [Verrucomicrobiae bacterium]|nr:glycogen/starch synthase [Verrucomicrobiae bacterium]